ncbi:MAG: hypothetical protein GXO18_01350 [Aquificae bacterium]|nr:hypothetical protein [Aquificota bacterium]
MRKPFIFFLWLFLLVFVIASLYISFTAYLYERDAKLLANISAFFVGVNSGLEKVSIPYPKYTVIMYKKEPSGKFVSSNALPPEERDNYIQVEMPVRDGKLFLYVRKIDLKEYLSFVGSNTFYTGLLVASLLLYLSIFYFTLKEFEIAQRGALTEELLNRLKALRLTMATLKVIPEESVEEMKKLVDGILKDRLSKR